MSRRDILTDRPDFAGLHNMAKHIIHLKEGAEAALSTSRLLLEHHEKLCIKDSENETFELVHQQLRQKVVQFEVWKLQISSLKARMQNIINLVRLFHYQLANEYIQSKTSRSHSMWSHSVIATSSNMTADQ